MPAPIMVLINIHSVVSMKAYGGLECSMVCTWIWKRQRWWIGNLSILPPLSAACQLHPTLYGTFHLISRWRIQWHWQIHKNRKTYGDSRLQTIRYLHHLSEVDGIWPAEVGKRYSRYPTRARTLAVPLDYLFKWVALSIFLDDSGIIWNFN